MAQEPGLIGELLAGCWRTLCGDGPTNPLARQFECAWLYGGWEQHNMPQCNAAAEVLC